MNDADERTYRDQLLDRRAWPLLAGVLGLAASILLLFTNAHGFYQGYLFAFAFWVGVSLGCLAILMLHHLVAGEWGLVTQRILESGASTVVVMAVFFIPILFGMHELYEWTHEEAVGRSAVLQHKQPYLNATWFTIRAVIYFASWIAMALLLARWSLRQDETEDARYTRKMRRLSAGGLVAHVLLMTFASVDWMMSIEPHWFSSVYGWMIEVSQALSGIALVIVVLTLLRSAPVLEGMVRTKHFHDYGNLLLAFVILWAYLMFAQYLIIWSGNIPEDVEWYVHRKEGLWYGVGPFLIVFHFAVPFAVLLLRPVKRVGKALSAVAAVVFAMHVVYLAWLILPGFRETNWATYAASAAAFVGIGGCWLTLFLTRLGTRRLLPKYDPRFEDFLKDSAAAS